jgi:hypothetical protein
MRKEYEIIRNNTKKNEKEIARNKTNLYEILGTNTESEI